MRHSLPEPDFRVFKRAEHEFLRIAARVTPRWERLCSLGQTPGFDWSYLRVTALAHQLDGIVAWRLLAEELDGTVPNIVRDDCQRYLDYIDGYGVTWREDWELLRSALEAANIEYVQWGGIIPYAEYVLPSWPRMVSDIDLAVPGKQLAAVRAVFASLGPGRDIAYDNDWVVEAILPGGTPAHCWCDPTDQETACRNASWVFEGAQDLDYLGVRTRVPAPGVLLLQQALDTWSSVHNDAGPLPLNPLAYIANLAQRLTDDDLALIGKVAEAEGQRITRQSPHISEEDRMWAAFDIGAVGRAAWIIERAYEVYELPAALLDAVGRYKPQEEPAFPVWDDYGTFSSYTWRRWSVWPGAEAFMFDHRGTRDPLFHVARGLWQEVPGFERTVKLRMAVK